MDAMDHDPLARRISRLAALVGLCLGALVAVGPLELRDGLPLGPVTVTSTEMIAALAALVGAAATLLRWRLDPKGLSSLHSRRARWLLGLLALWAAVHLASAAWASGDRAQVVKYSLRLCGQMSLAGLALIWSDRAEVRRRLLIGAAAGLAIITTLGTAERLIGRGFEFALLQFRDEPTWMLGEQRLSTVFYHANTCAAYLELMSPLVMVLALSPDATRWQRRGLIAWGALAAVLLSLTYSRAGLIAGVVGGMAVALAGRWQPQPRRWLALGLGWAALVLVAYAVNPDMRARIGLDERSYRPQYRYLAGCTGYPGSHIRLPLEIHNRGTWDLANRQAPAHVISTFLTRTGKQLVDAWDFTPMADLPAGATVVVDLPLTLPTRPGDYAVAADILRDRVLRISGVGAPLAILGCTVVAPGQPLPQGPAAPLDASSFDAMRAWRPLDLERRHYWRAALLLWARRPLLGWGADRFHLIHREYVPSQGYDPRARAHSIFFETAVDLGLLGVTVLVLLLAALVSAGRLAFRGGWRSDRGLAVAIAAGLCALGVHSLVDYFFGYTQIAVVVWPLIGLLLGIGRPDSPVTQPAPDDKPSP